MIAVLILCALAGLCLTATDVACGNNCAICSVNSPTFQCYQCQSGFYLDKNYVCSECMPGCSSCQQKYSCNQCFPLFAIFETVCLKCSEFCYSCQMKQIDIQPSNTEEINEYVSCTQCWPGFYEVENSKGAIRCEPCIPACNECDNTTQCTECMSGFGYNSQTNECYSCGEECDECNSEQGCLQCAYGYRPVDQQQITICQPCGDNCLSCESNGTCNNCAFEYYLTEGSCELCQFPCIECTGPDACEMCQVQYFLKEDKTGCEQCQEGCSYCLSLEKCQQCTASYFLTPEGQCVKCSSSCLHCIQNNYCYSCAASYYLKEGNCLQCPSPCETCSFSPRNDSLPQYSCSTCESDQYISFQGQCLLCNDVQEYAGCLTCSSLSGCLTCMDGFQYIGGECQEEESMKVIYIVLISIAIVIALAAIGFGIWACWKSRSGYGAAGEADASGVRTSYYEFP